MSPFMADKLGIAEMCCQICSSKDITFQVKFVYSQKNEFGSKVIYQRCLNCNTKSGIDYKHVQENINKMCYECEM